MIFYIYIYLDPRKPRVYKYENLEFDYEPFYVGKGKEKRWETRNHICNQYLINKLQKIGYGNVLVKFLVRSEDEATIHYYEEKAIKEIGRKDLNKGPLVNLTDGGEGNSGRIFSIEHRLKLSKSNMGKSHPGYWTNKKMSKSAKEKMSRAKKGKDPWNKGKRGLQKGHIISDREKQILSIKNSGCNNGMATLDEDQIIKIRELYQKCKNGKIIAKDLNIPYGTVFGVISNRTYKNVGKNNE